MAACNFILMLTAISITWRCVSGQGLGPGNCLVSRLDVIPCEYGNPGTTAVPGPNEYGVYTTRFREGSAGFPVCRIRRRDHQIYPIDVIGSANKVYVVYSPGFTLSTSYGNQFYVDYNIQCEEGLLAFLNITDMNMEEPNCANPNLNNELSCVDYVQVQRGEFGVTENCGTDTAGNDNQFELGNLRIILRTSQTARRPGFRATVICFDPGQADLEGCTQPEGENDTMATSSPPQGQRKKRDLEMFNNQWKRRAHYITRMKRQALGGDKEFLRFMEINVPHGTTVFFRNRKLEFMDDRDDSIVQTIEGIFILHTFDAAGDQDEFKEEASVEDEFIPFPGPGPLIIVGRHAFFTLFVIDPRGLVPSPEEMLVLANLTEAQLEIRGEDPSQRLSTEFLNPPTTSEFDNFPIRRRRQDDPAAPSLEDQAILVALANENACNPVLRASANSIIEEAEFTDPERLASLRATLPTDPSTTAGSVSTAES